jgi:hypothetical protein
MKNKLLEGLIQRWCNLVDESEKIFFEEHPWLENPELKPEIVIVLRRHENDVELEKTRKAIAFELHLIELNKPIPTQSKLLLDM